MATDKDDDKKPKKKDNPLHDNPRSKVPEKKVAAAPEPGADDGEKPAAEKPAEGGGDAPAKEPETGIGSPEEAGKDKMFMDGMKAIQKRHESERRDHHGNMREQIRQIGNRHNKEIADHFDLHFGEGGTAAAATEEKPPAVKAAEEK